jgi:hypothetical protein
MGLILGYFDFSCRIPVGIKEVIKDATRMVMWIDVVHE